MSDLNAGEKKSNEKKKCEHQWARIWLASKNYQESQWCTKCLELKNAASKARQESR